MSDPAWWQPSVAGVAILVRGWWFGLLPRLPVLEIDDGQPV